MDFQLRLAAELACAILAERHAPPMWGWPQDRPLFAIELETGERADDIRVVNAGGDSAYIQAKLRLDLRDAPDSDLGKTLVAFAEQYLDGLGEGDRLGLAVGPGTSSRITNDLPRLIERAGGLIEDRPLDSVADTDHELRTLAVVRGHLERGWQGRTGENPSEQDLRGLLRVMRVSVHDLAEGGAASQAAQAELRRTVLAKPEQAGLAWDALLAIAGNLAAARSGADRERLQTLLLGRSIGLNAPPSYRADIERLRGRTKTTLAALEPLSRIALSGSGRFKIERVVPAEVLDAAAKGSILVTGDPGAGKSASLFELITALIEGERDVVAIAADSLEVGGAGQLRDELGLEHEVLEVLRNWPGEGGAVLVIDGLDAARGEATQQTLLDLIAATQTTTSRWSIAASVRRFDLRYNHKLRDLFPVDHAAPVSHAYTLAEFGTIRHLAVPELSGDELGQLKGLAPALHALLEGAPQELRELARVPFNLKLLAELVLLDIERSALEPLSTQVQLLDLYWERRVIGADGQGDARSSVVAEIVEAMVAGRRLRAERQPISRPETSTPLSQLLSEAVLAELSSASGAVEREILVFSHHVLFDYAVERSLLRGAEGRLAKAILERPDLLLFARPSFDLHFRHLWEVDPSRQRFWEVAVGLVASNAVPQVGRIVAAVIASEMTTDLDDLRPLLEELDASGENTEFAEEALRHLIGAAVGSEQQPIWRGDAERTTWAAFAEALAGQKMRSTIAFPLRLLVSELVKGVERLGEDNLARLGRASRVLLADALDREIANRGLTWPAVEAVAATYASAPHASRALLGRILEPQRLERFGYVEMPGLADQAGRLVSIDPGFVRDIYATAFTFEETSKEETPIGNSAIMPLTSHRSQDYAHAHYVLAEAYPGFLQEAPVEAIAALIEVRGAYGQRRFSASGGRVLAIAWPDGRQARILEDGSSIWDREPLGTDYEVKILAAFEERLDHLAEEEPAALAEMVDFLLTSTVPASIWRRLLLSAARHPAVFAPLIGPLLIAPEALANDALQAPIGEYLRVGFIELDDETSGRAERAILALPAYRAVEDPERDEAGARARDRLLGCLPPDALTEPEAQDRLRELIAGNEVPANHEVELEVGFQEDGNWRREELIAQGVDVDSELNQRLQGLQEELRGFASEHLNSSPSAAEVEAILPALEQLEETLAEAEFGGASNPIADETFGHGAAVAEAIARSKVRDRNHSAVRLATRILLVAARHRTPVHDPARDEQFDKHPSWGSPAPRIEAAGGLVFLASEPELCTEQIREEIERLSRDPDPAVRYHIVRSVGLLRSSAPKLMTEIAERVIGEESSTQVVDALLRQLPAITGGDLERSREIAESLYTRTDAGRAGADELRRTAIVTLLGLYVWRGDEAAGHFLRGEVVARLSEADVPLQEMIFQLRSAQTTGAEGDADRDAIRSRALVLIEQALRQAISDFEDVRSRLTGELAKDDPDRQKARRAAEAIDAIAIELYLASGAFKNDAEEPRVAPEQAERLYREASSIVDLLAGVPVPSATHHLVETLASYIEVDPRGVFVRVAKAVESGKAAGYQFESLAVNLVVSLVERYLAEYRTLLQGDEELRALLMAMLDILVEAGWPQARGLTYGLHELFR